MVPPLPDVTMTRHLPRRLLALALASALAPAWSQTAPPTSNPFAPPGAAQPAGDALAPALPPSPEAFTVSDIRVEGLQRISAGTVFTYLPIERGDTVDASRSAEAIRALYKTGFFEDIRLDRQGDILVVTLVERPAINKLTFTGNKDIKTEDLTKNLKDIGLAEGETFDRLALDRVTQELQRAYNNRGKYSVEIAPTVTRLDRNRVDITVAVKEGKAAKIQHINLVGNEKYGDELITDNWESREHNWLSWYKRDDQYSREKLSGDIEKLNNFYLDRGYVDFSLDSTQVAISPDKRDMFITAGLTEGDVYTISEVKVSGDTVLPQEELERIVALVQPGQVFSRRLLEYSSDAIVARLGNIGYAFAQVNPIPTIDTEKDTVGIDFRIVPGPRVNVRRIVFKGNSRTADEVLRREMRQFEGAWYSQAAIDRSKVRLQRLGYFESVEVDIPAVAGTDDQVDLVFDVKETTSGSFMLGVGYSQLSGINASVQLSENNFLGSGNHVSIAAQRSGYQQRYDFSFTNPYFTDEGMSLGYNLWWRELDYADFNTAQYSTTSAAAQVFMGLPITESDTVSSLFGVDSNEVLTSFGTPQRIVDYIDAVGNRTFHTWRAQAGYSRDTRNQYLMPSAGTYQRISAEVALPGSTVEYYKIEYDFSKYWPLASWLVLNTTADFGYGDGYGDDHIRHLCVSASPDCTPGSTDYQRTITAAGLPFFENFYAGGVSSSGRVRGFVDNTLGPQDFSFGYAQPIGGSLKTVGSLEFIFPTLFDTPAARISAFLDFGNVFDGIDNFDAGELRASAGVALVWRSPMGPIAISYALPVRKEDFDQTERLQFTFTGGL
jgi:outer membrane protein insertion porin family